MKNNIIAEETTFTLTKKQMKKFEKWRNKKDKNNYTYSFCFTQTGIGVVEKVNCSDGTELDLTEYDKW